MARIVQYPNDPKMDWWEPGYQLEALEKEWDKSLLTWIEFIQVKNENELFDYVKFIGYDGGQEDKTVIRFIRKAKTNRRNSTKKKAELLLNKIEKLRKGNHNGRIS